MAKKPKKAVAIKTPAVAARSEGERRRRQADRFARILRLLHLLQGPRNWRAAELADELECKPRTVYRHLEVLREAGVAVIFDYEAGSYRIPFGRFPVTNLTPEEIMGLATASALSQSSGLVPGVGAKPTAEKIAALVRDEAAKWLHEAVELIQVHELKLADHSHCRPQLKAAQWALMLRRQLRGRYKSPHQDKTVALTLHPYRLCLIRQAWYLIARPKDSTAIKTYRVARFESLNATDDESEDMHGFDLKEYLGNAWGVYRGERSYEVVIEFSEEAAELVTETIWHPTQQVSRKRGRGVTLTFKVDGLEEILWWVLGWSGRAKVIRPPELREMVRTRAAEMLAMHEDHQ